MTKGDIMKAALFGGYPVGFRKALSLVLDWECVLNHVTGEIEWENDPDDHGGSTFAGLTVRDDAIPQNPQAEGIVSRYFNNYWNHFNGLPILIQELVFFEGVNIGNESAIRALQFALNDYGCRLTVDGKLGDLTRQASFAQGDTTGICMAFLQKIRRHYEAIAASNSSQRKFLAGWENRITAAKDLLA
jgi:lysozyme family protein